LRRTEGPSPPAANPLLGIRGIGPARLHLLSKLGIRTIEDALLFLPRHYEDRRRICPIGTLEDRQKAVVLGKVVSVREGYGTGTRRRTFEVRISDGTTELRARWFHHRGLRQNPLFKRGRQLYLFGTVTVDGSRREMIHPEVGAADDEEEPLRFGRLLPCYPLVEGLSQRTLGTLMERIVAAGLPGQKDFLPPPVRRRHRLPGREEALRALHLPSPGASREELEAGRSPWHRRLVFEELLVLQLGLQRRKALQSDTPGRWRLRRREEGLRRLLSRLPFSLTAAQERAYEEIASDMASSRCMQRLLQGDVGSGKTLVAAMACLLAVENGAQAALMAPTEILAEQHYLTLRGLMEPLGLETALLSGGLPSGERRDVAERLACGRVDLVVGTHALIQSPVRFRRLALAVIDEQHRFGVRQRLSLWEKGDRPHLLVMTATPIPRSLALTLYGDLDCTVIDMLPPGRQPVATVICEEGDRKEIYEDLRGELAGGYRAFVVLPRVEEDGDSGLRAVTGTAEHLRKDVFPDYSVEMIHGRMGIEERERVMKRFRSGGAQVLVATTVVEVGVDIPEATVMLIEHAERFGLSQLHQLRGRIGRGSRVSRCYLMADGSTGEEARRRLETAASTTDGFRVAEEDLLLRGPGEFLGFRQSGLPPLRVADLVRDREILIEAREEADRLLRGDKDLRAPEHRLLRERVNAAWRGRFFLAPAG
jgi:ATP-dependent DNA helicase RecG